jgi:hypothetical protein
MTLGIDTNTLGSRGENLVYLNLTSYGATGAPLFSPAYTGEKCPDLDYVVRLNGAAGFFFVQIKTHGKKLPPGAKVLKAQVKKATVQRLLELPVPTYVIGVEDITGRCFVRAIASGLNGGISQISTANILDDVNRSRLYDEVAWFWRNGPLKPASSVFG